MTTLPTGAFDAAADRLRQHGSFLFLKSEARYLDPGVPRQWAQLAAEGVAEDVALWGTVEEVLLDRLPDLEARVYFPVPMARQRDLDDETLRERFSYRMVTVNDDQRWFWNGTEVAERTRLFFTEHLFYEPAVERYGFEYAVNAEWVDKSYLDAHFTPMVARRLSVRDGQIEAELNNGRGDRLAVGGFRFDERERLLAASAEHGEVLVDGNERFRMLRHITEDLAATELDGLRIPLAYESPP